MIAADARSTACRSSRSSPARRFASSTSSASRSRTSSRTPTSWRRSTWRASRFALPSAARTTRSSSAAGRACSTPSRSRRSSTRSSSARARRPSARSSPRIAAPSRRACAAPRRSRRSRKVRRRLRAVAVRGRATPDGAFVGHRPVAGRAPAAVIAKRVVADLDAVRRPICGVVPFMDVVHDRFGLEVLRGCTPRMPLLPGGDGLPARARAHRRHDRARRDRRAGVHRLRRGRRSRRCRPPTTASSRRCCGGFNADSPERASRSRCRRLRVDAFGVRDGAARLGGGKKSGLTFAPEAGTQRMRDVINKNVTEDDLLGTRAARVRGRMATREALLHDRPAHRDRRRCARHRRAGRHGASCGARGDARRSSAVRCASRCRVSTFVPKAQTPFQWEPQIALRRGPPPPGDAARVDAAQGRRAALARLGRVASWRA